MMPASGDAERKRTQHVLPAATGGLQSASPIVGDHKALGRPVGEAAAVFVGAFVAPRAGGVTQASASAHLEHGPRVEVRADPEARLVREAAPRRGGAGPSAAVALDGVHCEWRCPVNDGAKNVPGPPAAGRATAARKRRRETSTRRGRAKAASMPRPQRLSF